MPPHKKLVAQRRPNQRLEMSPAASTSTRTISCSVCRNEQLDVHPIGSNNGTELVGCDVCRLRYLRVKLVEHEADYSLLCIYCYRTFSDKDNFHLHLKQHGDFLRMSPPNISNSPKRVTNPEDHEVSLANGGRKTQITRRQNSKGFQFTSQQSAGNSLEDVVGTMLTLGSSLNILNSDSQPKIPSSLSRADTIIIQPQLQTGDARPPEIRTRSTVSRKKMAATRQSRASALVSSDARQSKASALESSDTLDLSLLLPFSQPAVAKQSSNASDATDIVTDGETSSSRSSLKKDDTIILEVLDNDGNKSDQILLTSMDKMTDLDLSSLCQSILGPQKSVVGKLASEDTIDRILPGFSMSIINLLQEDEMIIVNDQSQGKSFQIRRVPSESSASVSESTPVSNPNIVVESPVNTENQNPVLPQMSASKQAKQPDLEKTPRLRDTRKRRASPKEEEEEEAADKKRGRHVEKEQHTCPECGKVFNRRYNLKVHRYVHSEQKMLECETCQQQFKHVSLLRNHVRIKHTSTKPFICEACGQGFIHNNYLQRHRLLHVSEACVCCNQKFESRRQFNAHVRSVHVGPDSSKHCQKCNLTFVSLLGLCQHLLGTDKGHH